MSSNISFKCGRILLMAGTAMMLMTANQANAQTDPNADVDGDAITVTARKRSETVLAIPISITAYDSKSLADRNIRTITDLANNTPGLALSMTGTPTAVSLVVRGLASSNFSPSLNLENNVGIFIDGIYQTNRNTVDVLEMVDIGQVSLAKGPQSALYGRSTFSGALSITTKDAPSVASYALSGTLGSDEDRRISGSVGGPIIDGILNGSLKASYLTFDGTNTNSADTANNLGGYQRQGLSGVLNFTPAEHLSFKLTGLLAKSQAELPGESLTPYTSQNCGAINALTLTPMIYCGEVSVPNSVSNSPNIPKSSALTKQIALESRYTGDHFSIVSVTGLTWATDEQFYDYDGFANGDLYGVCTVVGTTCPTVGGLASYSRTVNANSVAGYGHDVSTFSQEFRVQSPDANRLQWLAGASYFNSKIRENVYSTVDGSALATNERLVQVLPLYAGTNTGPLAAAANPQLSPNILLPRLANIADQGTKTYSLFGSLGYKIAEGLRVSAEGRYNIDKKFNNSLVSFFGPGFGLQQATFRSFTPRFTVEYNVQRDLLVYFNAAKGVHSGGFNGVTGVLANETTYNEESNWTYELGLKGQAFDHHLKFALAGYKVDWQNIQVPSYSANTAIIQSIVRNLGGLTAKGVDFSADLRVNRGISFGGSLNYTDAKYGAGVYDPASVAQCGGTPICNYIAVPGRGLLPSIAGNRPPRSVKFQWNLHSDLSGDLSGDWRWTGRVDVNHTGSMFVNGLNLSSYGDHTVTNLRLAIESPVYSISLWATNLFNVNYISTALTEPRNGYPSTLRTIESYMGETRRVGLTAAVKF